MHFAVNAQILSPVAGYRQAGVSGYIERLLRQLLPLSPADRWTVYTPAGIAPARLAAAANTTLCPSALPTTNPLVRILWEQLCAPLLLVRDRPAVLFCPLNVVPLAAPCPTVVTIHDLAFLRLPERFRPAKRRDLTQLTSLSVRRARHVITVSDFTRREVIELLHVPPERVTAIPNGRDETLVPPGPAAVAAFRQHHALPPEFLLFVGTLEPRKNLLTLLRAYAQLRDRLALPLIIAGGKGWLYEPIFALVKELELEDRVRFTGYVDQADLPLWYGAATASLYPSLYEGFGFPPLESMQCGTPVITSNTTSLPEVVGDAALLVDPHDIAALAAALLRISTDPALRADLRTRGLQRAQHFDWQHTAAATLAVLRTAAHPAS